jgi:hypothetical protein
MADGWRSLAFFLLLLLEFFLKFFFSFSSFSHFRLIACCDDSIFNEVSLPKKNHEFLRIG